MVPRMVRTKQNYSAENKSASSGTLLLVFCNWSSAEDTREPANARLQKTDNIRHRFRQAKNVENRNADGASRAREEPSEHETWCQTGGDPPSLAELLSHEPRQPAVTMCDLF